VPIFRLLASPAAGATDDGEPAEVLAGGAAASWQAAERKPIASTAIARLAALAGFTQLAEASGFIGIRLLNIS
jgi:hypothetical protein